MKLDACAAVPEGLDSEEAARRLALAGLELRKWRSARLPAALLRTRP